MYSHLNHSVVFFFTSFYLNSFFPSQVNNFVVFKSFFLNKSGSIFIHWISSCVCRYFCVIIEKGMCFLALCRTHETTHSDRAAKPLPCCVSLTVKVHLCFLVIGYFKSGKHLSQPPDNTNYMYKCQILTIEKSKFISLECVSFSSVAVKEGSRK